MRIDRRHGPSTTKARSLDRLSRARLLPQARSGPIVLFACPGRPSVAEIEQLLQALRRARVAAGEPAAHRFLPFAGIGAQLGVARDRVLDLGDAAAFGGDAPVALEVAHAEGEPMRFIELLGLRERVARAEVERLRESLAVRVALQRDVVEGLERLDHELVERAVGAFERRVGRERLDLGAEKPPVEKRHGRGNCVRENGGWGRIRTGVHGFAGRCITTLLPSLNLDKKGRTRLWVPPRVSGAGNEARTRDLNLGKVTLYQLSYSRRRRAL